MATANVNGLSIAYDVIGDGGRPWTITPGGRYTRTSPGVRELAEAIAERGNQVVIWDRPNCGESSVCFEGASESDVQADALAGLLRELDLGPAVITGGSGGSRVSLLTAAKHPDVAQGLAVWWISGGIYGLMALGVHYCGASVAAAWAGGMEAVLELDDWQEVLEANPDNRERFLAQDPKTFIATMERWMEVYCACGGDLVPGLPDDLATGMDLPALVFRSGESDMHHTRATSEAVASLLPRSELVEPPWGDREWIERHAPENVEAGLFQRWPLLAPHLLTWADTTLP
jgi:pimeloyl-ACP methyl ester carboxylesterase